MEKIDANKEQTEKSDEDDDYDEENDSSDVSSSSTDSDIDDDVNRDEVNIDDNSDHDSDTNDESVEEEEDEVIKAIRRENDRQRDHPPTIKLDEFIADISFSPTEDLLAVANISGDVLLYKYANEENTLLSTWELHTKACRSIEFSQDGKLVYSVAKDKAIMLTEVDSGKLNRFYDNAHSVPIYSVRVIDDHLFATGTMLLSFNHNVYYLSNLQAMMMVQ